MFYYNSRNETTPPTDRYMYYIFTFINHYFIDGIEFCNILFHVDSFIYLFIYFNTFFFHPMSQMQK